MLEIEVQDEIRRLQEAKPPLVSPSIKQSENQPEYSAQYALLNRERMSIHRKINRLKNPEASKVRQKRYYYKNLARVRSRSVLYWKNNPEKRKQNWQRYYQKNREKCLENAQRHAARNVDSIKERAKTHRQKPSYKAAHNERLARRRAIKSNNSAKDIAILNRLYKTIREKLHVRCYYCAKVMAGKDAHIDHVFPLAKGGKHSTDNLCVACPECNHSKNARHPNDWGKIKQLILL